MLHLQGHWRWGSCSLVNRNSQLDRQGRVLGSHNPWTSPTLAHPRMSTVGHLLIPSFHRVEFRGRLYGSRHTIHEPVYIPYHLYISSVVSASRRRITTDPPWSRLVRILTSFVYTENCFSQLTSRFCGSHSEYLGWRQSWDKKWGKKSAENVTCCERSLDRWLYRIFFLEI